MPAKKNSILPVEPLGNAAPLVIPVSPVTPISTLQVSPAQPLAPGDERTWGMLAHLSTLLNLVIGFGGPIAALIIYLVYKDRSRYVAYHSLQALIFQLIWWFGAGVIIGVMWAIVGALSAILIGIVLIPGAALLTPILLLMPVGALVFGIVGAVQVNQGRDFKYWLVGDWVRGTLTSV